MRNEMAEEIKTQTATFRWQLWIVAFGFFMQTLDTTIVNTAIAAMTHDLNVSPLHAAYALGDCFLRAHRGGHAAA